MRSKKTANPRTLPAAIVLPVLSSSMGLAENVPETNFHRKVLLYPVAALQLHIIFTGTHRLERACSFGNHVSSFHSITLFLGGSCSISVINAEVFDVLTLA